MIVFPTRREKSRRSFFLLGGKKFYPAGRKLNRDSMFQKIMILKLMFAKLFAKHLPFSVSKLLGKRFMNIVLALKIIYGFDDFWRYVVFPTLIINFGLDRYVGVPVSIDDIIVDKKLLVNAKSHLYHLFVSLVMFNLADRIDDKFLLKNKITIKSTPLIKFLQSKIDVPYSTVFSILQIFNKAIYFNKGLIWTQASINRIVSQFLLQATLSLLNLKNVRSVLVLGCYHQVVFILVKMLQNIEKIDVFCDDKKSESIMKSYLHDFLQMKIDFLEDYNLKSRKYDLVVVLENFKKLYTNTGITLQIIKNHLKTNGVIIFITKFLKENWMVRPHFIKFRDELSGNLYINHFNRQLNEHGLKEYAYLFEHSIPGIFRVLIAKKYSVSYKNQKAAP